MYKNLAQYPQETPFNCQTQVVYDIDQAITFSEKAKCLGKPILMGIMPLKSVKMDRYMKDQVEGIDIPDEIIFSMEKEGKRGLISPATLFVSFINTLKVSTLWLWGM